MALFLIVAGVTGILLPWEEELTMASRPGLSRAAPPHPGARTLDGVTLAEQVAQQTGAQVSFVYLDVPKDHVVRVPVRARPGEPPLHYDTIWADPYTGQVKLKFRYAVLADGAQNIMPFLYQLHYSLALGPWGIFAFGIAALIWTLDCFVGFYLTLPMRKRAAAVQPIRLWWSKWKPAWTLRWRAGGHKRNFDLHRASGLWLWPLLFVFAWSSVGFCLPSVQRPIMSAFGATDDFKPAPLPEPLDAPPIDFREARDRGHQLMEAEGRRLGFNIVHDQFLLYQPALGLYRYSARTTLDIADHGGRTTLWFSAVDGKLVNLRLPLGNSTADATMSWFYMLHMAEVFGLPYRIFVSILGACVVTLTATGILIWMKKRSAKLLGKKRTRLA